jgi:hypothetical protein
MLETPDHCLLPCIWTYHAAAHSTESSLDAEDLSIRRIEADQVLGAVSALLPTGKIICPKPNAKRAQFTTRPSKENPYNEARYAHPIAVLLFVQVESYSA